MTEQEIDIQRKWEITKPPCELAGEVTSIEKTSAYVGLDKRMEGYKITVDFPNGIFHFTMPADPTLVPAVGTRYTITIQPETEEEKANA